MCINPWSKENREAYQNAKDIQAAQAAAARNYLASQNGTHNGPRQTGLAINPSTLNGPASNTPYKSGASMSYASAGMQSGDDDPTGGDIGGFGLSSTAGFGGASSAGGDGGMSSVGGGGMSSSGGDGGMSSVGGSGSGGI